MTRKILIIFSLFFVSHQLWAEQLAITPERAEAILEKTVALEKDIQQRQVQENVDSGVSQEYRAGYTDGYNKAVLDLVKSKLLNDPTIKPSMIRRAGGAAVLVSSAAVVSSAKVKSETAPVAIEVVPTATVAPVVITNPQAETEADRSAVKTNPEPNSSVIALVSPTDWLEKANQLAAQQKWTAAIDAASEAINIDPQLLDAYVLRSWAYAENGHLNAAIGDVDTAIALNPEYAVAYNNRAYAYEIAGKSDQAIKDYEIACEMQFEPACDTLRKLNEIALKQRQQQAAALVQKSLKMFQNRDWKAVVALSNEALTLDANNTTAYANRAGAYTEMGLFDKALDDCNQALIIDPNFGVAYNNKGYAYELMGERKKAILEYETACVLGVAQSCHDFTRLTGRQMTKP